MLTSHPDLLGGLMKWDLCCELAGRRALYKYEICSVLFPRFCRVSRPSGDTEALLCIWTGCPLVSLGPEMHARPCTASPPRREAQTIKCPCGSGTSMVPHLWALGQAHPVGTAFLWEGLPLSQAGLRSFVLRNSIKILWCLGDQLSAVTMDWALLLCAKRVSPPNEE
jgi:hypothetical protein